MKGEKAEIVKRAKMNGAGTAWVALGGLVCLGLSVLILKEIPAMRRELKILRM
jgi:hypothetical protein